MNRPSAMFPVLCLLAMLAAGCSTGHRTPALAADHVEVSPASPDELRQTVQVLSQDIGERNCYRPANLQRAADWVRQTLSGYGYAVRLETFHLQGERFHCADQDVSNIIAELPGTELPKQIVIVGAHYDSRVAMASWHDHTHVFPDQRGTPGANDNGSGVAAVLAIARQMAGQPHRRTIRFCFWVNEEPPFYHTTDIDAMGSYVSAGRSKLAGEDIRAVISFDVAGCYSPQPREKRNALDVLANAAGLPRSTDYVAFLTIPPNGPLIQRCSAEYAKHSRIAVRTVVLPYVSPIVSWSDDWAYTRHGFPAFCVTDTAFLRSDNYHELGDTFDKMDFGPFADVVWGVEYTVRDLADRP
jgi:Peptidase family M28